MKHHDAFYPPRYRWRNKREMPSNPHQTLVQFLAALTIIVWDGAVTFAIWMIIKYVFRVKLRFSDEELLIGDVAIHGEEAYPQEDALSSKLSASAGAEASPTTEEPVSAKDKNQGQEVASQLTLRGRSVAAARPRRERAAVSQNLFGETAALRLPRRRRCCSIMCVRYSRAGGNGARARRPARSA
jgi:cytoskeletal protein RodZ